MRTFSPIGRFLSRAKKAPQQRLLLDRASLWICGQHKSVAHKPTGPTAAADNLNDLEIRGVRTTPGSPSESAFKATRHGCYDRLRRLYAGPDSRSHLEGRAASFGDEGSATLVPSMLSGSTRQFRLALPPRSPSDLALNDPVLQASSDAI